MESADHRDIHSTTAADHNAEDHHEGTRFKFQRILCCFNNYR